MMRPLETRLRDTDAEMCEWLRGRLREIVGPSAHGLRYLGVVFTSPPHISTTKQVAEPMLKQSFVTRVFREALPSTKETLAFARLIRARALLADDGATNADVAYTLRYSSPQGFSRHTRLMLGVSPHEWRLQPQRATAFAETVLARLVTPYVDTWQWFDPWMESHALAMTRARAVRGLLASARHGLGRGDRVEVAA